MSFLSAVVAKKISIRRCAVSPTTQLAEGLGLALALEASKPSLAKRLEHVETMRSGAG